MKEYGRLDDPTLHIQGKTNYVRNPEGMWVNVAPLREEAQKYLKYKRYCPDPYKSPGWFRYWKEQKRRCVEGYSVGGIKITGHHYFYLNFCPIWKVEQVKGNVADKVYSFPDFWDGDYHYFWALEIARRGATQETLDELNLNMLEFDPTCLKGGYHMIVGKSRRKGYSYKNAAICSNTFINVTGSISLIGAFDKKYLYPEGTMGMASSYLNLLNTVDDQRSGFKRERQVTNSKDHRKASYLVNNTIERGSMSQIIALSFGDNPSAARGKDGKLVLFEEAGKFPNLKESFKATEPAMRAGAFTTGQIVIFGTGGDMESGTLDFAEMYYNPVEYRLMRFVNIWDDDAANSVCGFFHPVTWNMEKHYDKNGNSDIEGATAEEEATRKELLQNSTSSTAKQSHVQEYAYKPSEAFLTVSINDFPVAELNARLRKVKAEKLFQKLGMPVVMSKEEGHVKITPDLTGTLKPISTYKYKETDLTSAVVIFEDYNPLFSYGVGYDPFAQDQSTNPSLGSIYVMCLSGTKRGTIVATYNGRPNTAEKCDQVFYMLCEYYKCYDAGMYENMVLHVKTNAEKYKALKYLASQPDAVISQNIRNSKVARIYGCHMNDKLKDAGAKYIKEWLLEVVNHDEEGFPITRLETLVDIGLLEELIAYNLKGNFDRVMALMMVMFLMQERDIENPVEKRLKDAKLKNSLDRLLKTQFAR